MTAPRVRFATLSLEEHLTQLRNGILYSLKEMSIVLTLAQQEKEIAHAAVTAFEASCPLNLYAGKCPNEIRNYLWSCYSKVDLDGIRRNSKRLNPEMIKKVYEAALQQKFVGPAPETVQPHYESLHQAEAKATRRLQSLTRHYESLRMYYRKQEALQRAQETKIREEMQRILIQKEAQARLSAIEERERQAHALAARAKRPASPYPDLEALSKLAEL